MITTILLNIIYVFVLGITSVISQFGDVSQNNAITDALATMSAYLVALNDFLPVSTLLAIIAFELAFEASVFTYKLVRWGYQKVPGIN